MDQKLEVSKALVDHGADFDDMQSGVAASRDNESGTMRRFLNHSAVDFAAQTSSNEGIEPREDLSATTLSMSWGSFDQAFLPGAPTDLRDLKLELCEFASVFVATESRCGKAVSSSGEEARQLLEESFPDIMWKAGEFFSVKIHAITCPSALLGAQAESTKQIPLSWVNRIVSVRLDFGEVMGLFSDASLRNGAHVYLVALPGEPEIPPLPASKVHCVLLVPKVMHASVHLSQDGRVEVHKYMLQNDESIWVRELHLNADSPIKADIILRRNDYAEDCTFHMCYHRELKQDGYVYASFYRFPAPRERDSNAAENEDWRMRWAVPNVYNAAKPNVYEYYAEFDEGRLEFLAEQWNALEGDNVSGLSALLQVEYSLWRSEQRKQANNE